MTIDDCINYYNKSFVIGNTDDDRQHNDILEMTIDTMRKYQKIVQIMVRTVDDGTSMYDTLQEIEEVIEDGNDD